MSDRDGSDDEFLLEQMPPPKIRHRVKVLVDWCRDEVYRLISAVELRPLLWNSSHKDHMCKVTREAAWQEIAAEFGGKFDTDQLSAKWYNLRIQFKAYWAKQKREQGMSHITWKYFKPLMFIGQSRKEQRQLVSSDKKYRSKCIPIIIDISDKFIDNNEFRNN